jgi:hypothetical protein
MKHRYLLSILMAAMVVAALSLIAAPVVAQTQRPAGNAAARAWTPPKTSWGDPDLQGIFTSDDYISVGLQRNVNLGTRLYVTAEEAAAAENQIQNRARNNAQEFANPNANVGTGPPSHWGEGGRRAPRQTSLIVEPEDGRLPAMTPEGLARQQAATATRFFDPGNRSVESWENFTHYIRCISRGIAGSVLPVVYGNGTEIVQGPGYVAILQEMVHEARIIPLNTGGHVGKSIRSYMGDSVGRFEGNTLVIETTNLLDNKTGVGPNGGGAPLSEEAKITERLTRIDKDTIAYEMRVEDPRTYTAPFKVAFPIRQESGYQNFEYACHEGNHGMMNQLSGSRAMEKAAAEAANPR